MEYEFGGASSVLCPSGEVKVAPSRAQSSATSQSQSPESRQTYHNGETRLLAPMPGVIVMCEKGLGDQVCKGDVVVILEAMKMENLITAPVQGKVVSILCKEGERVRKGTLLALIA